jgi:hypothetical protein
VHFLLLQNAGYERLIERAGRVIVFKEPLDTWSFNPNDEVRVQHPADEGQVVSSLPSSRSSYTNFEPEGLGKHIQPILIYAGRHSGTRWNARQGELGWV